MLKYGDRKHLTGAILISVPIIVIRINLPVADWENETFVWLMGMRLHTPILRDTPWLLFIVFPSSCTGIVGNLFVCLCAPPGQVVSLIVEMTMTVMHMASTFLSFIH